MINHELRHSVPSKEIQRTDTIARIVQDHSVEAKHCILEGVVAKYNICVDLKSLTWSLRTLLDWAIVNALNDTVEFSVTKISNKVAFIFCSYDSLTTGTMILAHLKMSREQCMPRSAALQRAGEIIAGNNGSVELRNENRGWRLFVKFPLYSGCNS